MLDEVKRKEYSLTVTGPHTPNENNPRQRVFSKGRCWKHLTTCEAISNLTIGSFTLAASTGLAYIVNDLIFTTDPESSWGKMNHTLIDYGALGSASVLIDIGIGAFAFMGAGLIGKTCYAGIKEGRVQRGQTPLLNEQLT
ncbi:MAG: hypothetical protein H0X29_06910 [Parachlamydiaceae bacterium]|nr:hypothetical protein [Parachlamydiaceae bacterium]